MEISKNLVLETTAFKQAFNISDWEAVLEEIPIIGLALNVTRWAYRVRLSKHQAVIALYTSIGYMISFEQCEKFIRVSASLSAEEIYSLIIEGVTDVINRNDCIRAIGMIKEAIDKTDINLKGELD